MTSLHELRLTDLFEAATLMDYEAEGLCLGMQVENANPSEFALGLTPVVIEALPNLLDTLLAELVKRGCEIRVIETGEPVEPGFHHTLTKDWSVH